MRLSIRALPLAALALALPATGLHAQEQLELVFPDGDRRIGVLFDDLRRQSAREARHASGANGAYADYLRFKKSLSKNGVTATLSPTLMFQWGSDDGDPAVNWLLSPSVDWTIFKSDRFGQGSLQFGYLWNEYSSNATGSSVSSDLGLLSGINDSGTDSNTFIQLTYTQVFPGNKVQVSFGQYPFFNFDDNAYADDQQANFYNESLAQNASATYSLASLGAYVQVNPTSEVSFAFGAQDANNVSGESIEFDTFGDGPWAWFGYAQWTPSFKGLGSAQYSLLYYEQPSVPAQPESTSGWSFNAVQNLDDTWGLFARANASTGSVAAIERSIAGGVIMNDPLGRNPDDQLGFGLAWNKTNKSVFTGVATRDSEVVAEAYWNFTVGKMLQIGPGIQVIPKPALDPGGDAAAVLSLRMTGLF
jgi:hypothetical protein